MATTSETTAPKPDLDAKAKKNDFEIPFKTNLKRKFIIAKIATIFCKITIAAWMQPRQYDSQSSVAQKIVFRKQPRHQITFIAGYSHFRRKNKRFRIPIPSPNYNPYKIYTAIPI
jgi:hypothetical protein